MLQLVFLCIVLSQISAIVTEPIRCDISKRTESCPVRHCCARDEFLPEYVICKKIGTIDSSCATVPDESVCPCGTGLVCVPNVNSQTFVSIYGTCQPNTTTVSSTTPTTTMTTRTTKPLPVTTKIQNHPPLIQLKETGINVYQNSEIDQTITTFTVVDNDSGHNGEVQCTVLQPPFFKIERISDHTYKLVVSSSLSALSTQTILVFLICEDGGNPKLNGVAQLSVEIVRESQTSAKTTVPDVTSTTGPVVASTTEPVVASATEPVVASTTGPVVASTTEPVVASITLQTSSVYSVEQSTEDSNLSTPTKDFVQTTDSLTANSSTFGATTKRSLISVTFN